MYIEALAPRYFMTKMPSKQTPQRQNYLEYSFLNCSLYKPEVYQVLIGQNSSQMKTSSSIRLTYHVYHLNQE
jgi:hypothetical protein